MPVDRPITRIGLSPNSSARREIGRVDAAGEPIAVPIGLDRRSRWIAMALDDAARHPMRDLQPARAEQVEMMTAVDFRRRPDPAPRPPTCFRRSEARPPAP